MVPTAPIGLQTSAGNGQVSLNWSPSANAAVYCVKRSLTSGGPYAQIAATSSRSFTDTGVTNGTKYFYVVSAVNSAGESANSVEVNATPIAVVTPPAAPTGLQAIGGDAQVSLNWTSCTGATSYHVKRRTTSGGAYTSRCAFCDQLYRYGSNQRGNLLLRGLCAEHGGRKRQFCASISNSSRRGCRCDHNHRSDPD